MKTLDIKRVEEGLEWLQKEFESTGEIQSVDILIQKLDAINSCISWAGEQMAVAKRNWNLKKVNAYHALIISQAANESYYSASLAKEYVNARCHQEQYEYDLCERFTRALVHISSNVITSISALKTMAQLNNHTQSVPNY
jgi:hypothetical protein